MRCECGCGVSVARVELCRAAEDLMDDSNGDVMMK